MNQPTQTSYDQAQLAGHRARERCIQYYSLESTAHVLSHVITDLTAP
ncbi:hypothetical protein K4A83_01910 [Spirulina subsalsa FACHB-351]|uniref:Uncharacterized protein n=1 Tax=Spirulina subsalsa FACHB-351 TaxID=234711 RepID=A0ABT3L0J7_9CYAN|nr:hypothetical protein [Spirulina subsalsa]MCW6035030.1 hypothetical protein [Spirulina subsalsa FACHB-351]